MLARAEKVAERTATKRAPSISLKCALGLEKTLGDAQGRVEAQARQLDARGCRRRGR